MRSSLISFLLLITLIIVPGFSAVADDGRIQEEAAATIVDSVTNEYCPVMPDQKVLPSLYVEYEGKRVYLCCKMCRRQFLEDPERYLAVLPQFANHAVIHTDTLEDTSNAPQQDYSTHNQEAGVPPRAVRFIGKFHPALVHFPIALVVAALCAEILFLVTRKDALRTTGRFCVHFAAAGGLVAGLLGWAAASTASYPSLELTFAFHRWLGTTAAALLVVCATLSEVAARSDNQKFHRVYFVMLSATALLTTLVGHLGATLIYGPDHFRF